MKMCEKNLMSFFFYSALCVPFNNENFPFVLSFSRFFSLLFGWWEKLVGWWQPYGIEGDNDSDNGLIVVVVTEADSSAAVALPPPVAGGNGSIRDQQFIGIAFVHINHAFVAHYIEKLTATSGRPDARCWYSHIAAADDDAMLHIILYIVGIILASAPMQTIQAWDIGRQTNRLWTEVSL